jgi:hypothetical protein
MENDMAPVASAVPHSNYHGGIGSHSGGAKSN